MFFSALQAVTLACLLLLPYTNAQESDLPGTNPTCFVCGEGNRVGNPDALVTFPGQPEPTLCQDVEQGGLRGALPFAFCAVMPNLIGADCVCEPGDATLRPTTAPIAPVSPPTVAPTVAVVVTPAPIVALTPAPIVVVTPAPIAVVAPTPVVPAPPAPVAPDTSITVCDVCGDAGLEITVPEGLVQFPGRDAISCGDLQAAGKAGTIATAECPLIPIFIADPCGCSPVATTTAPAPVDPVVTPAPVVTVVTPAPVVTVVTPAPVVTVVTPAPIVTVATPAPIPDSVTTCDICGVGLDITLPDALVQFPGRDAMSCGDLQQAGAVGTIDPAECPLIPVFIADPCGCAPILTPCHVCGGEGTMEVTLPDALFEFPGQDPMSCGDLEAAGLNGTVDAAQCALIPTFIEEVCGCSPVVTSCSVCGEGSEVTMPEGLVEFPGEEPIACGALEAAGLNGTIDAERCSLIPGFIAEPCGCTVRTCSVCGDGLQVTLPEALVQFPGEEPIACGALEAAGANGTVDAERCSLIPGFIAEPCGCSTSSPVAVPASTPSPVAPVPDTTPAPVTVHPSCSICGEGKVVSLGDTQVEFPGQTVPISCTELETFGIDGFLDERECTIIPPLIAGPCGCVEVTAAPITAAPITATPTDAPPTEAPVGTSNSMKSMKSGKRLRSLLSKNKKVTTATKQRKRYRGIH